MSLGRRLDNARSTVFLGVYAPVANCTSLGCRQEPDAGRPLVPRWKCLRAGQPPSLVGLFHQQLCLVQGGDAHGCRLLKGVKPIIKGRTERRQNQTNENSSKAFRQTVTALGARGQRSTSTTPVSRSKRAIALRRMHARPACAPARV